MPDDLVVAYLALRKLMRRHGVYDSDLHISKSIFALKEIVNPYRIVLQTAYRPILWTWIDAEQ